VNPPAKTHLLVVRFSAMGDVAMTIPVVTRLLQQYPQLQITFVSDKKFEPLFRNIPGLNFFGADIKGIHKGIFGLLKLYREIKNKSTIHAIADLHDSLRSKIFSFLFRPSGINMGKIDKGRHDKKLLTRRNNKQLVQLATTFQRYAHVFEKMGYPVNLDTRQPRQRLTVTDSVRILLEQSRSKLVGIAPFAKHPEKMYPPEKMEKVIEDLLQKEYKVFFFGGGADEINHLQRWEQQFKGTVNTAGKFSFAQELELISQLDLMISMDSANMHLASLYGVPVVSIWGATHPFAGFYGYGQLPENAIQVELYCRPCSVFGNKKCYRGDRACMNMIAAEKIFIRADTILSA